MNTQRSSWITGVVVLQLLYVLGMLALPVYLLVLTHAPETRQAANPAEEISGLRVAAAVVGAPALVALIGWFGLWRKKLWGWWLTVLTDLGLAGVFVYSLIGDGWKNIDWEMVALTLVGAVPVVYLLWPRVRKFYWKGNERQFPACGGVIEEEMAKRTP
jgi:uncharacterized membrane protein (DUF2068 family)